MKQFFCDCKTSNFICRICGKSRIAIQASILLFAISLSFAQTEQRFQFTLKTANPDSAISKIIKDTESKDGWFTNYSENYLHIRVPATALDGIQKTIGESGKLEGKNFSNQDKVADLERLDAQIQSRKKLLDTYIELVKNAPFEQLQSVEREMVNLNYQIENLQGQKNALEEKIKFVSVTINFNIDVPPTSPIARSKSPFNWINRTNMHSLKGGF